MPSDTLPAADPAERPPAWTTIGLILLLMVIFVIQAGGQQINTSSGRDLSVPDLVIFGGLNRDLVQIGGDWWRLMTAPLLHGGFAHLALNCVALYFAGQFIERHMGSLTLTGLLAAGALGGTLLSLMTSDDIQVSVGASGGIMALLCGALLLCFTLPEDADTESGKSLFARILVPSLIPTHGGIDYAAHFGGAITGGVLAALLYSLSEPVRDPPVRRLLAAAATLIYAAAALYGAVQLSRNVPALDSFKGLAMAQETKDLPKMTEAEASAVVKEWPGDPLARLTYALALLDAGKPGPAEDQAITALRTIRLFGTRKFETETTPQIKAVIALSRARTGHPESAAHIADTVCWSVKPPFRARLDAARLCGFPATAPATPVR